MNSHLIEYPLQVLSHVRVVRFLHPKLCASRSLMSTEECIKIRIHNKGVVIDLQIVALRWVLTIERSTGEVLTLFLLHPHFVINYNKYRNMKIEGVPSKHLQWQGCENHETPTGFDEQDKVRLSTTTSYNILSFKIQHYTYITSTKSVTK